MKTKSQHRTFLKQSAILGGSILWLGATEAETNRVGGAAGPANETLKTIRGWRTIHGNFQDQPLPEPVLQSIKPRTWMGPSGAGNS